MKVSGVSMAPSLSDGDYILAVRYGFCGCRAKLGQIVMIDHPERERMIKRVRLIGADGRLQLAGDGHLSISSEAIGPVREDWLRAIAKVHIPRRGRPVWLTRHPPRTHGGA